MKKQRGSAHLIVVAVIGLGLVGALGFIFWQNFIKDTDQLEETTSKETSTNEESETNKAEASYEGAYTTGGNFKTKIPNGWTAEVGAYDGYEDSHFILLAGPDKLESLQYDETSDAVINDLSAVGWDGLTEHFYILSQENIERYFSSYEEEPFTLDDGTQGKKYTDVVSKSEQTEMEVFQKDSDGYIRSVYEFEKNGVVVRAYLNYYSNSSFDLSFGEKVIRSIKF